MTKKERLAITVILTLIFAIIANQTSGFMHGFASVVMTLNLAVSLVLVADIYKL